MKNKFFIFIFRKDLRLVDNTALFEALHNSEGIFPLFIIDPNQISQGELKSKRALKFLGESLKELHLELKKKGSKLHLFYGNPISILENLIPKFQGVYSNRDYIPESLLQDRKIEQICRERNIEFKTFEDYGLKEIENRKLSKNFSFFYKLYLEEKIPQPRGPYIGGKYLKKNFKEEITFEQFFKLIHFKDKGNILGGRKKAIYILKNSSFFSNYDRDKDLFSFKTTQLSAHLKFGTVSAREVFHSFKDISSSLIRQLIWRDFWMLVTYYYPQILEENYNKLFSKLEWNSDEKILKKWKQGNTGFPIVDASMRELKKTGWMSNRGRLIVSSFLCKNLMIHWKEGARYFSEMLIDYCPIQNQNNWQVSSGTGFNSIPWFRMMNPWIQQKKYDLNTTYIKKWIPELENVSSEDIHNWFDKYHKYPNSSYSFPILDHKKARNNYMKKIRYILSF